MSARAEPNAPVAQRVHANRDYLVVSAAIIAYVIAEIVTRITS